VLTVVTMAICSADSTAVWRVAHLATKKAAKWGVQRVALSVGMRAIQTAGHWAVLSADHSELQKAGLMAAGKVARLAA